MSGVSTELVYWDTCIFYAMLKNEEHGEGILDGIRQDYAAFKAGRLRIITSTITIAEVAAGNFEKHEDFERFKSLRFANGFEFVPPIVPVMELASVLKDYYFNNPLGNDGQYNLFNIADAIHVATAIKLEVDSFVTLDGRNKKSGEIGLLKLGPRIANMYDLVIRKPIAPKQIGMRYE
ncbi:type II toxin-antitoxin system VapC family toxin [Porticoccus sp.]